jgi:hypothetical protein
MINPFDPYGLYTDPNQPGVGKNIIGANKAMAPQQQPVGLLGIQPRQIPHAKFEEEQANGAGFKMAADAFMKDKKNIPQQGLNAPQQTSGLMFGQEGIAPNYNFEAPTTFGLDQYQDIGLNQIRPDDYTRSGLGLFLNKYF